MDRTFHVYRCDVLAINKRKLVVPLLATGASWMCSLINSNRTTAQEQMAVLRVCTPLVDRRLHAFLRWDSYLDISKTFVLPDSGFMGSLGVVNRSSRRSIVESIYACTLLPMNTKKAILAELETRI